MSYKKLIVPIGTALAALTFTATRNRIEQNRKLIFMKPSLVRGGKLR